MVARCGVPIQGTGCKNHNFGGQQFIIVLRRNTTFPGSWITIDRTFAT